MGRRAEIAAIAAGVRRGVVTVVWGLGGAGKTSLVRKTIAAKFPKHVPRVLHAALVPGVDLEAEVLRALAAAVGAKLEWAELTGDALAAAAIDLAESGPWWIVIDDLQHADPARASALLAAFARYARKSRLIATTRVDPALAAGTADVIPLGAMAEADLVLLARRAKRLGKDAALAAARSASGSPWRLLHRLASPRAGASSDGLGLEPELSAFLEMLAAVGTPLPKAALAAFEPPETLETLAEWGLVERSGIGFRVHDAVRSMLPAPARETIARARSLAGRALVGHADAGAALEGARFLLDAGEAEGAARALAARGDDILAAGLSPALWLLLDRSPAPAGIRSRAEALAMEASQEPRLERLRLRCAADFGATDALARVEEPAGREPEDLLEWARVLRLRGELARAAGAAAESVEAARRERKPGVAFEAGLLRARCRIVQGDANEVHRDAVALVATNEDDAARRESLIAQALAYAGRSDEAIPIARDLARRAKSLSPAAAIEVGAAAGRTLYEASLFPEAEAALDAVLERLGPSALSRSQGRIALLVRAYLAQDRGRLRDAAALAARLAPGGSLLSAGAGFVAAVCRIAAGDFDGLDERLAEIAAGSVRSAHHNNRDMANGMRVKLATVLGRAADPAAIDAENGPDPTLRNLRALWARQNRLRHGAPLSRDTLPSPRELSGNLEVRALSRIVASEWSLVEGDAEGAIADARTASVWAREAGFHLLEAEAMAALCDALLVAGRDAELASEAKALDTLAAGLPAVRLVAEARFHRAVLGGDPAVLEPLARARAGVHHAARRARLLLDGAGPGDALDRAVVAAARTRASWRSLESLPRDPAGDGEGEAWGIDETRTAVWLADGRVVKLAKRLFEVLLAIAARGGAATKEELVRTVWHEREYHRLRHDNRLHLTILKARRAIEDDPAHPTRLVATPDGYALCGRVRLKRTPP